MSRRRQPWGGRWCYSLVESSMNDRLVCPARLSTARVVRFGGGGCGTWRVGDGWWVWHTVGP